MLLGSAGALRGSPCGRRRGAAPYRRGSGSRQRSTRRNCRVRSAARHRSGTGTASAQDGPRARSRHDATRRSAASARGTHCHGSCAGAWAPRWPPGTATRHAHARGPVMLGRLRSSVHTLVSSRAAPSPCSHEHPRACHLLLDDDCIPPRECPLLAARSSACCGTFVVAMPDTQISILFESLYCGGKAAWHYVATSCGHDLCLLRTPAQERRTRRNARIRHCKTVEEPTVNRMKYIKVST